ncbi:hypothetical protein TTHERM_000133608 (macronuclear) [Tetrahymena thermophila SB210]|uniref:Uncharacterized protein n=1 Tax=Tetrahymena thermophila (strain SB210) TaxID=312017 RepID=W7XGW2_TETTS|nr:hypothetical protein TTHERM_000133608 [Tetrahymena thermophila SB210]EWS73501.1 hypothetical protein TTHERM_000133608 [Tetrahymena thermophila SB210]|eukprot:XP_012653983.1 hypothetical protein TTHERM_000133608 [Tetrahymena thermophila SB210]
MELSDEQQTNTRTISKSIYSAYELVNKNYKDHDFTYISIDQTLFVTDYVFSNFEVDKKMQQTIIKQIKQMGKTKKKQLIKREDLKIYLSQICMGCRKRQQTVGIDDVVNHIGMDLVLEIENMWIQFKEQEIYFITKEKTIEIVKSIIQRYKIDYSKVSNIVEKNLNSLYKHVFVEDFISLITQIGKEHDLRQKKVKIQKQNCGCTIF